jgi:hypothetical protein
MSSPVIEFHCDECDRDFARPQPRQPAFTVEGVPGVHADFMRGRLDDGAFIVEAGKCPQCASLVLRKELRDLAVDLGWQPPTADSLTPAGPWRTPHLVR